MIFHAVSNRIAAQFMAFVFAMLVVTGAFFFVADAFSREHFGRERLQRQVQGLLGRTDLLEGMPPLSPFQRERVRIVGPAGESLFSGALYESIPFQSGSELFVKVVGDDARYQILTVPVERGGSLVGYVQVAEREPYDDLTTRVALFLLVSGAISGLTFGVGLFFARRSLKPAEEMFQRLEQFTQDASHELRTPLTAVGTSLDLALRTPDNRAEILAAKRDLKEVTVLVERLLELARLDSFVLHSETTDLSVIVREAAARHQAEAEAKGVSLQATLPEAMQVQGDAALLRQAVSNLVANAIKFNVPGGKVFIELTSSELAVRDTGRGIPAQALPRVFDRFFQADASRSAREGLGLGLALVKRIVELHGWSIRAESEEGSGASFIVSF